MPPTGAFHLQELRATADHCAGHVGALFCVLWGPGPASWPHNFRGPGCKCSSLHFCAMDPRGRVQVSPFLRLNLRTQTSMCSKSVLHLQPNPSFSQTRLVGVTPVQHLLLPSCTGREEEGFSLIQTFSVASHRLRAGPLPATFLPGVREICLYSPH